MNIGKFGQDSALDSIDFCHHVCRGKPEKPKAFVLDTLLQRLAPAGQEPGTDSQAIDEPMPAPQKTHRR